MPSQYFVRLFAALLLLAVPASAGTLYVPIVDPDGPASAEYQTRIWLTNLGSSQATVSTVRIRGVGDGTKNRDAPFAHRIAAGATKVLAPSGSYGLLELRTPLTVAVDAEMHQGPQGSHTDVRGTVPVIGSHNSTPGGQDLYLQGVRRAENGSRTLLGLVNLGHQSTRCTVELTGAGGGRLGIAEDLPVPALSNVTVEDVLELVGVTQLADANARVSCNRRFFAYLVITSKATGETVFVEPAATGGSSNLKPPADPASNTPPPPPQNEGGQAIVYTRNGLIHVPSRSHPTWTHDIQTPPHTDFGKVVVSMEFTPGNWHALDPGKSHSLFWLNRGGKWPKWPQNAIGFANAHGPGSNKVRAVSNLGKPKRPYSTVLKSIALQKGVKYRLYYEYDAKGGKILMKLFRGSQQLFQTTTKAAVRKIRSDGSGKFMLYFGHEHHVAGSGTGSERPTYGWQYANARVEFHPL